MPWPSPYRRASAEYDGCRQAAATANLWPLKGVLLAFGVPAIHHKERGSPPDKGRAARWQSPATLKEVQQDRGAIGLSLEDPPLVGRPAPGILPARALCALPPDTHLRGGGVPVGKRQQNRRPNACGYQLRIYRPIRTPGCNLNRKLLGLQRRQKLQQQRRQGGDSLQTFVEAIKEDVEGPAPLCPFGTLRVQDPPW